MPLIKMRYITRQFVRAHPDWVFLFGDNMERRGLGGQAREMRGEPNVIGIPTKWSPSNDDSAFFCDADLPNIQERLDQDLRRVDYAVGLGKTVILPADGIGTGRAQLEVRAPAIYDYITKRLKY
jgi:hypothetical protein